ncbi:hypothetical protein F5887DRAFT_1153834 [Amanita rubescens]|nr:hypothetical protein F5887DRAFT_1153834 [Amanita rubescens]
MFEDTTILFTAISAVKAICTWIEQLHAKQQKIIQLGQTVQALSLVLEPFQYQIPNMDLHKSVIVLLYDLLEILNGVKGHLSLWGGKSKKSKFANVLGFLSPSIALGMLSDDEKRLSQWINLFMLSLQIAMLQKQVKAEAPGPAIASGGLSSVSETTLVEGWEPLNNDVSSFWLKNVGDEKVLLSSANFVTALETWLQQSLDERLRNAVLLELDEQDIGSITRKTLQRFAGTRTLKQCIDDMKSQYGSNASTPPGSPNPQRVDLVPTLVWVDDEIENIKDGIEYAMVLGIRVIQLPSTIATKLWVEQNDAELRALEGHSLIHFITDNARWEIQQWSGNNDSDGRMTKWTTGPSQSLNMTAGDTILRYLRGHGYKAPVLVYCGQSMPLTKYVLAYSHAASTCRQAVTRAFIDRLAAVHKALKSGSQVGVDKKGEELWVNYGKDQGFDLV